MPMPGPPPRIGAPMPGPPEPEGPAAPEGGAPPPMPPPSSAKNDLYSSSRRGAGPSPAPTQHLLVSSAKINWIQQPGKVRATLCDSTATHPALPRMTCTHCPGEAGAHPLHQHSTVKSHERPPDPCALGAWSTSLEICTELPRKGRESCMGQTGQKSPAWSLPDITRWL